MKKIFLFFYSAVITPHLLFSQNVGIGISNPTRAKLELNGSAGATTAIFGGESTGISLQSNWPAIGFNQYYNNGGKYIANGYAAVQFFDPNSGYMYLDMFANGSANAFTNGGTRALSISNTGNVAIKTNPGIASLVVAKAGNFDGSAVFGGTSYNSHFSHGNDEHTYIRGGKPGSRVYLNDIPAGNLVLGVGTCMVGINTGNPTYTLEISQTNNKGLFLVDPAFNFYNWEYRVDHYFSGNASFLKLIYNGTLRGVFDTGGQYSAIVSDGRVKTNIRSLDAVLDKINLLQPSVYEMEDHNDNHEKTFGFIAQDVKPLFPGLVSVQQITVDSVNRIADLHSLNYTRFSVIAIKALQEQFEQIQALQKENDALMRRLKDLEKRL